MRKYAKVNKQSLIEDGFITLMIAVLVSLISEIYLSLLVIVLMLGKIVISLMIDKNYKISIIYSIQTLFVILQYYIFYSLISILEWGNSVNLVLLVIATIPIILGQKQLHQYPDFVVGDKIDQHLYEKHKKKRLTLIAISSVLFVLLTLLYLWITILATS